MRRSLSQPEPSVPNADGTRGQEQAPVFVSVVWAMDGPRFVAVADARRCQAGDHGRIWLMPTCTPGAREGRGARGSKYRHVIQVGQSEETRWPQL